MADRELTKTELHNKKLDGLVVQLRKDVQELVRDTVHKNTHRFEKIEDLRYIAEQFKFDENLFDVGFRRTLWDKLELQKTKEKNGKQKNRVRKTWEHLRK